MVPQTYDAAMRDVLIHEGGYSNDAGDPGGPTCWGITIFDVRKYLKPGATADDVKKLTVPEAMNIYRKHYAAPCRYDDLPAGVDYSVLDYGINSGVGRSGKVLRRLVGLPADTSVVSDEVIAAVAKRDPKVLVAAINDERLKFLQSLKTWPLFKGGWGRRVSEVKASSLHMLDWSATPMPAPTPNQKSAKGKIPEPTAIKNTVKVGVPGAGVAASASFMDWIAAHPVLTVIAIAALIAVIVAVIETINARHKEKSEAPMPGTAVVPESVTA